MKGIKRTLLRMHDGERALTQTSLLDYPVNERGEETLTFEFVDEDSTSKDRIEPPRTKELRANIPHDLKDEPSREDNYQDENVVMEAKENAG